MFLTLNWFAVFVGITLFTERGRPASFSGISLPLSKVLFHLVDSVQQWCFNVLYLLLCYLIGQPAFLGAPICNLVKLSSFEQFLDIAHFQFTIFLDFLNVSVW